MKYIFKTTFAICAVLILSAGAAKACTSPSGVEGEQLYNTTHDVMQYCDGTDWVAMNSIGKVDTATLTSGLAGKVDTSTYTSGLAAKLNLAGGTLTGALELAGAPTANEHAATKEYVDTVAASGGSSANGRFQISCWPYSATQSYSGGLCVMMDTQTGSTKCQYISGNWNMSSNWADCGGQLTISSLENTTVSTNDPGAPGVYAANAYGWGNGSRTGDGDTSDDATPSQLDLNLAFSKIMGGNSATCGVASGKPYCWGPSDGSNYGYKGNIPSHTSATNSPAALDLSSQGYPVVDDLVYGYSGGVFKTVTGQWYGFGRTDNSQVHYQSVMSGGVSVQPVYWYSNSGQATLPTDFTKFSLSSYLACGLRSNGNVHCTTQASTSTQYYANLGEGSDAYCRGGGASHSYDYYNYQNNLRENCYASGGHTFTDIAVAGGGGSYSSACAVANDNKVYCWGYYNYSGWLGTGSTSNGDGTPTAVDTSHLSPTPSFAKIYGSYLHNSSSPFYCALDTAGAAYCWGANGNGQLGTGDTSYRTRPTPVLGGYAFSELALGENHTCGVTTTGLVYCWGDGGSNQLGYGGTTSKLIPEPVTSASDYVGIGVGNYNTFGWR